MSLREFVDSVPSNEKLDISDKELGIELEPTKILYNADIMEKIVFFKLIKSEYVCVGNVLNSRNRLYRYVLKVDSDVEAYKRILDSTSRTRKPREKDFSNSYTMVKDFDLQYLPFIKFYPGDGGRYLSSSIYISCIDNICNASIHRTMLISKNKVVARIVPRHLRYIYEKYLERGKETPVAIVVGVHPAVMLMASSSPPLGVFELELVPNLLEDFSIAYTPLYGIPVPANAAMVLEGRITKELVREGPFVDLLNLYDRARLEPLINVDAVYVNTNELFHVILPAGKEHKLLQSFYREAVIYDYVSRTVPKVHKVRLLESSGSWLIIAIAIDKIHDGDVKTAIMAAFSAHPSAKMVIAVDSDIDIDSENMILWSIATRFRGRDSIIMIERARCSTLDPSSSNGTCDKIGLDLTIPLGSNKADYKYVKT
ncbi:UbiD family decarboxylase [Ignisphaera aggregans DSM 17230]|uniref:Anhydromevalonate phosphate decarboxylase n=1 Tax=Ignisphaera aggregans (strain DSM 17230 / JCM 13409 / AQ1.S1) TaxID=583356 RepID=E0STE6_IGNAA|nr:UbiD family decarboxylase [Ignisphaera aggregans DSM 17230]